ncbi:hypothetical protein BGZ49_004605 [Haplosporangium sp. Z 27]|nr:hypothetical protein BGZ49_004605 [Haplosporangium sp. Z 27]
MSSLLFQSNDKGGSGSSSTVNPLMNLAHFYEQELTDQHIDSSGSSRQYRQQTHGQHSLGKQPITNRHLFPTSPSNFIANSSTNTNYTLENGSYTQQAQDEFKEFSHSTPLNPSQMTFQQNFDHHPNVMNATQQEISDYLLHRQEYYFREAQLRSQDRDDGLGPIVDFSQQHLSSLSESEQNDPAIKSLLQDHLETRHYNPYAEKSHQFINPRMRASSQREQVMMDMNKNADSELYSKLDLAWQESMQASSSSTKSTDVIAASAMEVNTSYGDIDQQHQHRHHHNLNQGMYQPLNVHTDGDWSEEFARATMASSSQVGSSSNDSIATGRRDSLKTCGFMLDPKNNHDLSFSDPVTLLSSAPISAAIGSSATSMPTFQPQYQQQPYILEQKPIETTHEVYNDDVFEGDMLKAWMETLEQEKQEAEDRESDLQRAWKESLEQEKEEADERVEEIIERTIPSEVVLVDNEVCNDDVFEGNMLQVWMETLALERQEANERAKKEETNEGENNEKLLDESEQKLILEMALRRLNGLMHQLGQKPGFLEGGRVGMWRRDDSKISE